MGRDYYISMLVAAVISLGLAAYSRRFRWHPMSGSFFWTMLMLAMWAMTYYCEMAFSAAPGKFLAVRARPFFAYGTEIAVIYLAARFTGWVRILRYLPLLFLIPALFFGLAIFENYHTLFRFNYEIHHHSGIVTVHFNKGILYPFYLGYGYVLVIVYESILGLFLMRAGPNFRLPVILLMIAQPLAPAMDVLYDFGVSPVPGHNLAAHFLIVSGVMITFSVFRYGLLSFTTVARGDAVEHIEDIMVIVDSRDRIVDFNHAATRKFGISGKSIGHHVGEVIGAWDELTERVRQTNTVTEKVTMNAEKTSGIYMISVTTLETPSKQRIGRVVIFHDITAEEKAKEALAEAVERANRFASAADSANKAKSEFLAKMSHEIRTPMNAVLGLSEILAQTGLDPEQKKFTDGIRGSAEALLSIINDILDFSKIEAGMLHLENKPFNLCEIVEQTVWLMSTKAAEKGISILTEYSDDPGGFYIGDSSRVRQIVLNLLSNAVKFTERGRITVRVHGSGAGDETSAEAPVVLEVEDTGVGIPENELEYIFEKFHQVDSNKGSGVEGTGLGLAITKQLVQMMGGAISVRSRPGEGSVFRIALPLPAAGDLADGAADEKVLTDIVPRGLRVLVAEDIELNRFIAVRMLRDMRCEVDTAANGLEAVKLAGARNYDIIFMDCRMPELDGLEATKRIREREHAGVRTPIVALTAGALEENRENCLAAGMDDFIAKPIRQVQLKEMLLKYCTTGSSREGAACEVHGSEVQGYEMSCTTVAFSDSPAIFDRKTALELADGDEEFLKDIIVIFLREIPATLGRLSDAATKGDMKEAQRAAHSLKGMFSQICAGKAVRAALNVEQAAENERIDDIRLGISELVAAWDELRKELLKTGTTDEHG
ncbi:MAG: ATP-binding protein [bacterium]